MKKLAIIFFLFLLVLPIGNAITGSVAYANQPSSVVAGQSFSVLAQVQINSLSQGECSNGCLIELDPWTYNGEPITYVQSNGRLPTFSIINLGTSTQSACDNNPYYAGVITPFTLNNVYQATLKPKAPLQTGDWGYKVNVYNGCGGNLLLSSNLFTIKVTESTIPPPQDVTVYCLSQDKLACSSSLNNCEQGETKYSNVQMCFDNRLKGRFCASDTKQCPDGSSVNRNPNNNCNFEQCPQEIGTAFKLSNIKTVRSGDLSLRQSFDVYKIFGLSPIGFKVETLKDGQLVSVDITNVGKEASGATLEAFFISSNNPFLTNALTSLGSSSSVPFLQSTFLGKTGIEAIAATTCKEETGARYNIETIQPSVTKTFWIYVPYPKQGDILAGNNNYQAEKQYLLLINILDDCSNKNVYDNIGATANGFRVSPNQVPAGGVIPPEIPQVGINDSVVNQYSRQTTVSKNKLSILTTKELIKSSCSDSDMCEDTAICQTLDSLTQEGTLTPSLAQQRAEETSKIFDSILTTSGSVLAGYGSYVGFATALTASAQAVGTTASLPLLYSICTASGLISVGIGIPICLGIVTFGGVTVGGKLTKGLVDFFDFSSKKDLTKLGYCVPKEETEKSKFTDTLESIGKSLNKSFGGKAKTGLEDLTLGYILLGIFIFIIIITFSRRK